MNAKWYQRTEAKIGKDTTPREMPKGKWEKCPGCGHVIYREELQANDFVCGRCGYHFRLTGQRRVALLIDEGTFVEMASDLTTADPLGFESVTEKYAEKAKATAAKSGLKEAVITGTGRIGGVPAVLAVMDFAYFGGSMGSVVGEKVTRAAEKALELKCPLVIVSMSGGARMQEGVMSLMQMAKTSAALERLHQARLPFVSVLADPTTGGVTASYAMLGDLNIAEPGALVGFAGPRVIEQTIRQKLPKGFQRAEFLLEHGFVDMVVPRKELKQTLSSVLRYMTASSRT
jgi:acetyl-CoA carboxylase carboxyl transferase subunit beta